LPLDVDIDEQSVSRAAELIRTFWDEF